MAYKPKEASASCSLDSIRQPNTARGARQDVGLILRWRIKLLYCLDSEALIIAGCWSLWLLMGGILIWLMSYCWYWGLLPVLP